MKDFVLYDYKKKQVRHNLFESQKGRCFYCDRQCTESNKASNKEEQYAWFVLDHIIPTARGGSNLFSNIVGACWLCNVNKGSNLNWKPTRITVTSPTE